MNHLNNKKVYKFENSLHYDDSIFISEQDKNEEIKTDNVNLNFLPFDVEKNELYYWVHKWGLYPILILKHIMFSQNNNKRN